MNLWRIALDERSGRVRGEPERVTTPPRSPTTRPSRATGRLAYVSSSVEQQLQRVGFDPRGRAREGRAAAAGARRATAVFSGRFARRGMGRVLADRAAGGPAAEPARRQRATRAHERRLPRPPAALLAGRPADRLLLRPRRELRGVDDRPRRQRLSSAHARPRAAQRSPPGVVARRVADLLQPAPGASPARSCAADGEPARRRSTTLPPFRGPGLFLRRARLVARRGRRSPASW